MLRYKAVLSLDTDQNNLERNKEKQKFIQFKQQQQQQQQQQLIVPLCQLKMQL